MDALAASTSRRAHLVHEHERKVRDRAPVLDLQEAGTILLTIVLVGLLIMTAAHVHAASQAPKHAHPCGQQANLDPGVVFTGGSMRTCNN